MESECCSSIASPPARSAVPAPPRSIGGKNRQYRGVRMRKWGKWVAEIREPNKRTRIWLGSYSTAVAAARAYDTAVYCLRGRSARLNFPDEIEEGSVPAGGDALSAALIRKKATEVGARVDALHAERLLSEQRSPVRVMKYPDLNRPPSPDSCDE